MRVPRAESLATLATVLGVSKEWLLTGEIDANGEARSAFPINRN